jgi:hypothetical protein
MQGFLIHSLVMAPFENAKKAGLKIKTESKTVREQNQSQSVYTEYFKDGFERSDQSTLLPERTIHFVHVRDLVQARLLTWRSDRPEYRVIKTDEPPAEPEPSVGDPELIITTKTIGTGERAILFLIK